MAKVIDTCGLSCPQPVLMVHEAARSGDKALDVLVDNEASRENVTRAAEKLGVNRVTIYSYLDEVRGKRG